MRYLGKNFVKKIVDWIKDREVWTSGTGEGSIITVYNKNTISENQGAIGEGAVAEGCKTTAKGLYSHAEGYCCIASSKSSHAQGQYNIDNKNSIHSIGIGNDEENRLNAEYIYISKNNLGSLDVSNPKLGYKYLIGVGGYDGISTDNSKYKSVQEVIADLTTGVRALQLPVTAVSGDAVAMDANKVYDITIGESLTLTLNAPTDLTVTNEYQGSFDTGATAPTVTFPADVIWAWIPSVVANTHYEFNIRYIGGKYYGLVQEWNINTQEESI